MMLGLSGPVEHPAQETAQLMLMMLVLPDRASAQEIAQRMRMMLGLSGPVKNPAKETAQLMLMMLVLSGPLEQAAQEADAADARVERPARASCAMKVCG